jgi:hypothetical protein
MPIPFVVPLNLITFILQPLDRYLFIKQQIKFNDINIALTYALLKIVDSVWSKLVPMNRILIYNMHFSLFNMLKVA